MDNENMNKLKINTNWYECMQEFFFYTGRIRAKALANFFTEKSDLQFINSKGALFHNLIASLTHDDWNIDHWRWSERYILTRGDHIKKKLGKEKYFLKTLHCILFAMAIIACSNYCHAEICNQPKFLFWENNSRRFDPLGDHIA